MRFFSLSGSILGGVVLLAPLTGYTAARPASAASLQRPSASLSTRASNAAGGFAGLLDGLPSPEATTARIFVSAYFDNAVYVYNEAGQLVTTLTGFVVPSGLATDSAGNLYVADTGANRIDVFAPPYTSAPTTLSDGVQEPYDVAVDSAGNVAATNMEEDHSKSATVVFYPKGAKTPSHSLTNGLLAYLYFCAFDKAGNLYLDGAGVNPQMAEVVGGISGGSITPLTTRNQLGSLGGVQVTKTGLIAVVDAQSRVIFSYAPPVDNALGSPVATTALSNTNDPVGMAFSPNDRLVAVADTALGEALAYRFPSGDAPLATVGLPDYARPVGVAVAPTEQY